MPASSLARKPLSTPTNSQSDPRFRKVVEQVNAGAAKMNAHVPLQKANDPRFSAVLAARTQGARRADTAPAQFRRQERAPLSTAAATAPAESHPDPMAMMGVHGGRADDPATQPSPAQAQRPGSSGVLDYFAGRANNIPGFRMFTVVLGVNPINMSRVERSAANVLRAVVELLPGGGLITQALDNHGVFDRAGAWVEQQIRTLGMTGSVIRQAIDRFLDSLSWRDVFNPGGVWERARRIVTEPIDRILSFARGLVGGIVGFIKDAILRPLARLAQGTRGYDLLKAVLGHDPVTGDPVPRNAETLIGGFMCLIGQEEIWQNLQRANAVARAWAWFQGALSGLMGFVRQIPSLFVQAFRSLEIADIILVPRAFARIASVFGGFIGQFLTWAGNTVWNLLEIIFSVVAPGVMVYLRRAMGAFRTILRNPIGFVGNLVRAGLLGLRQFAAHFLTHLRASLIGWLAGAMSGANVYIPQGFNLREIIKFVLSVLGLTWQNIRAKLVRVIGETAVRVLETGFDIVVTLVTQGPAAAWEKIRESLSNLREMVMEQIMTFVRERVVQAAITRLVTSLNPAGAFIQAIIAIYNTMMFFVERLRQISQVAAAFIDSISAIASGSLSAAANRVEQTMAGLLTLVISFLARIAGLGRVTDAVIGVVNRVRQPIDRALDRVVDWIVTRARSLIQQAAGGTPQQRLDQALTAGQAAVNRFAGRRVGAAVLGPLLAVIRLRFQLQSLGAVNRGNRWYVAGRANPEGERPTDAQAESGADAQESVSFTAAGEQHRMWIVVSSGRPVLMVASNGGQVLRTLLETLENDTNIPQEVRDRARPTIAAMRNEITRLEAAETPPQRLAFLRILSDNMGRLFRVFGELPRLIRAASRLARRGWQIALRRRQQWDNWMGVRRSRRYPFSENIAMNFAATADDFVTISGGFDDALVSRLFNLQEERDLLADSANAGIRRIVTTQQGVPGRSNTHAEVKMAELAPDQPFGVTAMMCLSLCQPYFTELAIRRRVIQVVQDSPSSPRIFLPDNVARE